MHLLKLRNREALRITDKEAEKLNEAFEREVPTLRVKRLGLTFNVKAQFLEMVDVGPQKMVFMKNIEDPSDRRWAHFRKGKRLDMGFQPFYVNEYCDSDIITDDPENRWLECPMYGYEYEFAMEDDVLEKGWDNPPVSPSVENFINLLDDDTTSAKRLAGPTRQEGAGLAKI